MRTLLGRRRRPVDIPVRLDALQEAVAAGRGRIPDDVIDDAAAVLTRADERSRLSPEHTVVALAGSTGSGKSSLFNAISHLELARVGVLRPTTSAAMACVWGAEGSGPLLDWLGVPRRHQVAKESALTPSHDTDLGGLVLLDLPDHDSTEKSHRQEVDRLVKVVDLLIWVVDPQKYADAALHENYLRQSQGHGAVTIVALNQVDRLAPHERDKCLYDLRQLLLNDGLHDVIVLPVSAKTGEGLDQIHEVLQDVASRRLVAGERLAADISRSADRIAAFCGQQTSESPDQARRDLVSALSAAAGCDAVADAVEVSTVRRAGAAMGWPPTRWVKRLRPDPMRRLGLDRASKSDQNLVRTSLPAPTPVVRARAETAVRRYADAACAGAAPVWVLAARAQAESATPQLADRLDQAVAHTHLDADHRPGWWSAVSALQWFAVACLLLGLAWLTGLALLGYLQIDPPGSPQIGPFPAPTAFLLLGLVGGLLTTMVSKVAARRSAKRAADKVRARLAISVGAVVDELVVAPVEGELAALTRCREAAQAASGS